MNAIKKTAGIEDVRARLSTLWIFVMLNMIFADIFSFMDSKFLKELLTGHAGEVKITEGFLLVAAIMTEIPIAMVLLSRVLNYKANRIANIVAGVITILYVIGGGSATLHYLFLGTIEVVCMLFIIWYAWNWHSAEDQPS